MSAQVAPISHHPRGEHSLAKIRSALAFNTLGRRFHVEWDPDAAVTPLGQLVFFSQFLATAGLFRDWVQDCPVSYTSPNAPSLNDLLGTLTLAILAGQHRYAHVTALRADGVNPAGLGMSKVCSEDSVRRAFAEQEPEPLAHWQHKHLRAAWEPALEHPWILDIDVTVKPIYGHQEGAQIGYNPHKPGRPSHAYHSYFLARLRLVLDVEVRPGKEHAAAYGFEGLWKLWEGLKVQQRPELLRGDCAYGQEKLLCGCEQRDQRYLFRLRKTGNVKQLIRRLEQESKWSPAGAGWEGCEGRLRLSGWSAERRVVVLRRPKNKPVARPKQLAAQAAQGALWELLPDEPLYEYTVLVSNTRWEVLTLADLYRQRADSENAYDELKNQWGWGGFTTGDLLRCQVMARTVALVYNWWNLFVRCAEPNRPREAVTSRPLMLCAVGRLIQHAGQSVLRLTSTHAEAARAQELLTGLSLFLSGLTNTAEQLTNPQKWGRIWDRILSPFLRPIAALGQPSG